MLLAFRAPILATTRWFNIIGVLWTRYGRLSESFESHLHGAFGSAIVTSRTWIEILLRFDSEMDAALCLRKTYLQQRLTNSIFILLGAMTNLPLLFVEVSCTAQEQKERIRRSASWSMIDGHTSSAPQATSWKVHFLQPCIEYASSLQLLCYALLAFCFLQPWKCV